MISLKHHQLLDAGWLILLVLYVLVGTPLVPFHGDESTTIWMSRDYGYMFLDGDLERVRYHDPPISETEQHLRLITGGLTKYLMGMSWAMNGYGTADLNEQWDWGADWNYNQEFGHAPDDLLLMLGRWPASLFFAGSLVLVFWLGALLGGRPVAYLASGFVALSPALLLNARRAMFEGALIFFSLLTVVVAVELVRRRSWRMAFLLGVVSGLAVSAKHPALLTVASVYGVGCLLNLLQIEGKAWRRYPGIMSQWLSAFGIGLVVFLILNPVWWGDSFTRLGQVIDGRRDMLEGQVAAFGEYNTFSDRLLGFGRQVFVGQPQHYEVDGWDDYIGEQISTYESSIWDGVALGGSWLGAIILFALVSTGVLALVLDTSRPSDARWLIGGWGVFLITALAIVTPLEWQRYFVMAYPVVGLFAATGLVWIIRLSVGRVMNPKDGVAQPAD